MGEATLNRGARYHEPEVGRPERYAPPASPHDRFRQRPSWLLDECGAGKPGPCRRLMTGHPNINAPLQLLVELLKYGRRWKRHRGQHRQLPSGLPERRRPAKIEGIPIGKAVPAGFLRQRLKRDRAHLLPLDRLAVYLKLHHTVQLLHQRGQHIHGLAGTHHQGGAIPRTQPVKVPQGPAGRPPKLTVLTKSEEHTSELQSRVELVCRLLLEKKKNK